MKRQIAIAAMTLLLSLAAMLIPLPLAGTLPEARSIQVNARQFAYEPATISVRRGDTVHIHLNSLDAAHGFYIDGYGVNLHAEPGESTEATFVADQPGKFKIRCSVSCGVLHPFMVGELNVEPDIAFMRAVAAMFIATFGAVVFFRHD